MNNLVFIVDDEKNICELIRLYVEKEGYSTCVSHDGEDAVKKFKELRPDIVLLDIMLPKKDGWQVCREIRGISDTPIIMLTAKGELFDKVLGLELGADDYIVKPFEPKELVARIKAVLRRSTSSGSAPEETVIPMRFIFQTSLLKCRPKNLSFFTSWQATPTRCSPVTSYLMKSGAMNSLGIPVQ